MPTKLNRADLAAIPGMSAKAIRAFEEQAQQVSDNAEATTAAVAATQGINAATVLVLSANDAFDNERILAAGPGLVLVDGGAGKELTLRLRYPIYTNGGYRITFNAPSDVHVNLPPSGTLATTDLGGGTYADDAAAAAGGIETGETYRAPGGVVKWRQS